MDELNSMMPGGGSGGGGGENSGSNSSKKAVHVKVSHCRFVNCFGHGDQMTAPMYRNPYDHD